MFAARLLTRAPNGLKPVAALRQMASEARSSGFSRHFERRRMLKEAARTGETTAADGSSAASKAFGFGQGAVAGAAALGLGALGFYGLGFGPGQGAIEKQIVWPQYVKDRIRDTYLYFGGSLALTAGSAAAVFRSPALLDLVSRGGFLAIGATIAAMIGTQMLVKSMPYEPGRVGAKQFAWALHAAVVGAVVAPLCVLGGPILTRAAWYTAGMVGGLSTVAVCAPSDKFLYMGGPLAMGLGVVFASSLGSAFLPPTTALGAGLYSVALYGGLILFGAFVLYDTQRIIHKAEHHPAPGATLMGYGQQVAPFDPVNASIGIYLTTINIFIRIAQMLAMSGGRRK